MTSTRGPSVDERYAAWMGLALDLAATAGRDGDVPVGAVVVSPSGEVVGEGRNLRSFPIRVTYNRALGFDVTLEIDLEQIGPTREEQISRTESIGGRARSTRFGWSFTVLCPREIDGEDGTVQWLRQTFRTIFRLAYAPR